MSSSVHRLQVYQGDRTIADHALRSSSCLSSCRDFFAVSSRQTRNGSSRRSSSRQARLPAGMAPCRFDDQLMVTTRRGFAGCRRSGGMSQVLVSRRTRSELCSRRRLAASAVAERVGRSVDVTCGGCGERFELSVRREYQHRRDATTPKCLPCRRPAVAMSEAEREKYVAWWLYESGLDVDELVGIAVGLGCCS